MGSQSSSMSLPSQVTEKPELVKEKAGAEELEEQDEKAHASEPPTDQRSTFLRLPRGVRNIIYSYALAVEDGYSNGVWRGIICLADEPGYPPKLCSVSFMHNGYQFNEDYLTEDCELFKPFISRKAEAWRIEINQLKYVCKQLHRETRGITLKINAGRKLMFHGTRTRGSSNTADLGFHDTGRISGMANFVHFYGKCSPEQQEHIRNVDIIELPLDDEQPRKPDYSRKGNDDGDKPAAVAWRTRLQHIMALELREAFKPRTQLVFTGGSAATSLLRQYPLVPTPLDTLY